MNYSNKTEENLKKNKPSLLIPIMNTVFAVLMIAGCIFLKIRMKENFPIGYFIAFIVLIFLYPVGSWYTSYFAKIQNTKKIYNYENETKEIISYIKRLKSYRTLELDRDHYVKFISNYDSFIMDDAKYIDEHYSFGLAKENSVIITLGVSFAGFELDGKSMNLKGLCGIMPKSIWFKKKLKAPTGKPGTFFVEPIGFELGEKMIIQELKNQDTYYDKKTGWVVIGERRHTPLDENVSILNNVIVTIRNNELISVWIKMDPNMNI